MVVQPFVGTMVQSTTNKTNNKTNTHKLHFSFILHANQANVPYADVANDLNYFYVFQTFLKHPDIPITIHLSGTWLTTMQWYNSSTIDLIRQGIASGQFEILGSTYAQNIIYNTNNWDNYYQIKEHKQIIHDILNVTPTGFWNPERVWDQAQYVPLIANAGYQYTFVEDHIIQNSADYTGSSEFLIRNVTQGNQSLLIVNDDKGILSAVDPIAPTVATSVPLSTRLDNAINYLKEVYNNDTNGDFLVSYGQDMEAWGLWQEERNIASTQTVMSNLDAFLSRLENESSWLDVVHPGNFINQLKFSGYTFEHMNKIDFGEAQWMTDAANQMGISSWYTWLINDKDLPRFNQSFATARNFLQMAEFNITNAKNNGINSSSAEKLFNYAIRVFIANEYEFGCINCKFSWYNRAKVAMIPAYAVYYTLHKPTSNLVFARDLDMDGLNEFILISNTEFYVFTKIGGRLIFACSLISGDVFIGGDDTATYTNKGVNYENIGSYQEYTYPITKTDQWGRGLGKTYRIHQKAFNDILDSSILANTIYNASMTNNQLSFNITTPSYIIDKKFSFEQGKIITNYYIFNLQSKAISYTLDLAISPFYLNIERTGQESITSTRLSTNADNWTIGMFDKSNSNKFSIVGTSTKNFQFSTPYDELFGYHINLNYNLDSKEIINFNFILLLNITSYGSIIPPISKVSSTTLPSSSSSTKTTDGFTFWTFLQLLPIAIIVLFISKKRNRY